MRAPPNSFDLPEIQGARNLLRRFWKIKYTIKDGQNDEDNGCKD